jgi:hypothetical protein
VTPARGRVVAAARALALAALLAAGCAPRPTTAPALTAGALRERFERALAAREAVAMIEADATIWSRSASGAALPAVDADIVTAPPGAFRVRVSALFGTALDLAAHGDTVVGYVPARREAAEVDVTREALAIPRPGRFGVRLLAGAWRPPAGAWSDGVWRDSTLELAWREADDSLRLAIGASGLPQRAGMWRSGEGGVDVEYPAWSFVGGMAWPARIDVTDRARRYAATVRLERLRARAAVDPQRLAVVVPPGSRRLTWAELSRALRRVTELSP